MFQFPGFAFVPYVFRHKYLLLISANANPAYAGLTITDIEGGFPHSEIFGSKLVRSSPKLIAAYHVLHRLSAPRHPPNTLKTLDRSHYRCPPFRDPRQRRGGCRKSSDGNRYNDMLKTSFASNIPRNDAVKPVHDWCTTPRFPLMMSGYVSSLRC